MPVTIADDRVWFDSQIRFQQIGRRIAEAVASRKTVVLLAHFESTLLAITSELRRLNVRYERVSMFDSSAVCGSAGGRVLIGLARAFQPSSGFVASDAKVNVEIIVAEHHPLRSRDDEVINAAKRLSCEVQLSFQFSLDDPLMKYFGSTQIQDLMTRLGMPLDECISHSLVTNAIRSAQQKIESRMPKDLPAHSIEDWFKYNVRSE
jgi:hypothetical protein